MFRDDFKGEENKNENLLDKENITGKNEEPVLANTPLRVLTATSIIGDRVENMAGENLGTIKNIMLNVQTGCIEYMVLESGGFLGLGAKVFAIPFHSFKLNPSRQMFIALTRIIGLKQIAAIGTMLKIIGQTEGFLLYRLYKNACCFNQ